jgi:hypothetical protein
MAMVMRLSFLRSLTTAAASCSAPAAVVNIFQFPAMNFWRIGPPKMTK